MSDNHYFVTSPASGYNSPEEIDAFELTLREQFRNVDFFCGAFVMHHKDFDNCSTEFEMTDTVDALCGLLESDIAIVAAWDNPELSGYENRERLWIVPGKKTMGGPRPPEPPRLVVMPWTEKRKP